MKKHVLLFIIFALGVLNFAYAGMSTLPLSLYFKNYHSDKVLNNNNILDGRPESLLSENDDLVFSYKPTDKPTESFVLNGPIILNLYVEFDVREVGIEVFIYKLDSNGNEIQLEICNPEVRVKKNNKVNRVFIKTCPLEQLFHANENLLVKIRQAPLGKIYNMTKLHHSPKYPSRILINFDRI
ncbi:MAG: hypothetical protein A2381_00435 [Bdellovibrionales bacterium RIFOXYB1_FULL_37_110]|nr:MAG: hypothetical protein A2417_11490 [Bdellovibrionales bacterium RIFOXYC1_FULL_37_79]OFZ60861.1 MAG: hypothetical protein A2381_00435 [Bdellovibrionales bacterium RIFOXYB1_FULL_37_110]OFZ62391.1 MAG: hypothetical protein A2577_03100 [Bdellovibrionales bacterium RIFOXYD1_FULL_36_51]